MRRLPKDMAGSTEDKVVSWATGLPEGLSFYACATTDEETHDEIPNLLYWVLPDYAGDPECDEPLESQHNVRKANQNWQIWLASFLHPSMTVQEVQQLVDRE